MAGVFVVLEPFNHSYQIVEAAARKGFDVFVIHTLPIADKPPFESAAKLIHTAIAIQSWFEPQVILEKLQKELAGRRVVGTYCGPEITALCDAHIRSIYKLPGNDPNMLNDLVDKHWVRSKLNDAGLSKLACFDENLVASFVNLPDPSDFFFKPRNGGGSAYVKRIRSMADIKSAIDEWQSDTNNNPPILQDFVKSGAGYFLEATARGALMSAEGFTNKGEYQFFGLCGRMLIKRDQTVEVGSTFPVLHPRIDEIKDLTVRIHRELGYFHGPSHVEFMIPDDGDIEMVEFNPRLAGVTNLTLFNLVMKELIEDVLVDLGCGLDIGCVDAYSSGRFGAMCHVFSPVIGGKLESLILPETEFARAFKSVGDKLASRVTEFDYFACVMETGETMAEAVRKVEVGRNGVVVNGVAVADNDINDVITNGIY